MKKIIFLFLLTLFLSGCSTYRFQRGKAPYDTGFVALRDNYTILEYTVGKDNSVPRLKLAKERFKRRRDQVEYYYKKMGLIESRLKETFWDPPVLFSKFIGGIFRLPGVAISDYKYEHDPKYREKVRKLEDEQDQREEARINQIKEELKAYIQKDLTSEQITGTEKIEEIQLAQQVSQKSITPVTPETLTRQPPRQAESVEEPQPTDAELTPQKKEKPNITPQETTEPQEMIQSQEVPLPKEEQPMAKPEETVKPAEIQKQKAVPQRTKPTKVTPKEKIKPKKVQGLQFPGEPVAVIIAKPVKGYSPLKVKFYGSKSYAPKGRIIAYAWDFGDGETSTKENPVNTYYSGSFTPKYFTVTLTVQDNKGHTAEANTNIEVLNK